MSCRSSGLSGAWTLLPLLCVRLAPLMRCRFLMIPAPISTRRFVLPPHRLLRLSCFAESWELPDACC
jgi:hypothetical protein